MIIPHLLHDRYGPGLSKRELREEMTLVKRMDNNDYNLELRVDQQIPQGKTRLLN